MHSVVEIRSTAGPGGRSRHLVRTEGHHLAVRRTGADVLHLVGTAAGPLGGDVVEVHLHVGAGASLTVLSAAATIVLPHRERPDSQWLVTAEVSDGGRLVYAPEAVVVCADAEHLATTTLSLTGDAVAHVRETVVLGRSGETGGSWTGRLGADRDGLPLVHQTTRSAWLVADGLRTMISSARLDTEVVEARTHGRAVAMPLARGGSLVVATGKDVSGAEADLDTVTTPRAASGAAGGERTGGRTGEAAGDVLNRP